MTSTNDGKDVKSNQTIVPKGKLYYIELYKSLDAGLNSDSDLASRCEQLCSAWSKIYLLCLHSAPSTQAHLFTWIQRHTARIVLQTEWQSPKSKEEHKKLSEALDFFIKQCEQAKSAKNGIQQWEVELLPRAIWFQGMLANPWGHPVLRALLDSSGEQPKTEEVLEWLKEERGLMFTARLRQLAMSKCDDLALALLTTVMDRVRASRAPTQDTEASDEHKKKTKPKSDEPTFESILSKEASFADVWDILTDMELVLLHKSGKSSRLIELAKQTPLTCGYSLVERLLTRLDILTKEKKLWKNAKEVAILVAQVMIARCMVVPACAGGARTVLYCCARALVRLLAPARLPHATAALAAPAATARHLHTLATAVHAHQSADPEDLKPFVVELYVRAITFGMNELEKLKLKLEKEKEARCMEQTLSSWFIQLGALLTASIRMKCECTLTAFSVHPSHQMYDRIKAAPLLPPIAMEAVDPKTEIPSEASKFGSWANDSRSKTNFVKTSETLNIKKNENTNANVLSTAILNEGEALGLGAELCQDIAVLLSGPRVKTLSWDMDREVLLENCRAYMERTHGGTRALTTELKYLNLDLNQYQHLPEEEDDDENDLYYGIEKGYEHLVELQEPQPEEIFEDSIFDIEVAESFDDEPIIVPRRKKKVQQVHSDSDSDPLSLMAESKREKQKERPHSKERSKERKKKHKKPKDPVVETKEESKDKKEKKERKKKEKDDKSNTSSSMAGLIGVKVTKIPPSTTVTPGVAPKEQNMTDSDYDSQRKMSLNSEGNEFDILYDGQFSMDELKSPERTNNTNTANVQKNYDMSLSNGTVTVNKKQFLLNSLKPVQIHDSVNRSNTELNSTVTNQMPTSQPSVNVEVKKSITKLLQFRRQKADTATQSSASSSPHSLPKSPDYVSSPSPNMASYVGAKVCQTSGQIFFSSKQTEQLKSMKNEANTYTNPTTKSMGKNVNKYSILRTPAYNPTQTKNVLSKNTPNPVTSSSQDNDANITNSLSSPTSANIVSSRTSPEPTLLSTTSNTHLNSYQEFLKNLQQSSNPGITSPDPSQPQERRKELKPISRVIPVIPNIIDKKPTVSPQCAKSVVQQKKVENAPNTFARLSYMHKKNSEKPNLATPDADSNLQSISDELDKRIAEMKRMKAKHMHDKVPSQAPSTETEAPKEITWAVNKNIENVSNLCIQHPALTNILKSNTVTVSKKLKKMNPTNSPRIYGTKPKHVALSDKDQQDLLQLIKQQKKLKPYSPTNFLNRLATPNVQNIHLFSKAPVDKPDANIVDSAKKPVLMVPQAQKKLMDEISASKTEGNVLSLKFAQHFEAPVTSSTKKTTQVIQHKVQKSKWRVNPAQTIVKKVNTDTTAEKTAVDVNKANARQYIPKPPVVTPKFTDAFKEQDWASVLDALMAHKTPSRGPNALDMVLKKDSFEKVNERNQKIQAAAEEIASKTQQIPAKPSSSNLPCKIMNNSLSKDGETKCNMDTKKQNQSSGTTYPHIVIHNSKIELPKQVDSFMSGIPNSDYETLDELMDDDLRREIRELSSDEENYRSQNNSAIKAKIAYTKNDEVIKKVIQPKLKPVLSNQGLNFEVRAKNPVTIRTTSNQPQNEKAKPRIISNEKVNLRPGNVVTSNIVRHTNVNTKAPNSYTVTNIADTYVPSNSLDPLNIFMAATQPPVQNVVVVGAGVQYDPFGMYVNQNYITMNNPTNVLYQHQYPAPVVNPVLIATAVTLAATITQPVVTIATMQTAMKTSPAPITISHPKPTTSKLNTMQTPRNNDATLQQINVDSSQASTNLKANLMPQPRNKVPAIQQAIDSSRSEILKPTISKVNSMSTPKNYVSTKAGKIASSQSEILKTSVNKVATTKQANIDSNQLEILKSTISTANSMATTRNDVPTIQQTVNSSQSKILKPSISKNNFMETPSINVTTTQQSNIAVMNKSHDLHLDIDRRLIDVTLNKSFERKVLSEVQEKLTVPTPEKIEPKSCKNQRLSFENEVQKVMLHDERLLKKRLAIINREIHRRSYYPAIPLSYTPLKLEEVAVDSTVNVDNRKAEENLEQTIANTVKNIEELIASSAKEFIPSTNQNTAAPVNESKENKFICRRILLRSSNKIKGKVVSLENSDKPGRKAKVKLKDNKETNVDHCKDEYVELKDDVMKEEAAKTIDTEELTAKVTKVDESVTGSSTQSDSSSPLRVSKRVFCKKTIKTKDLKEKPNTQKKDTVLLKLNKNSKRKKIVGNHVSTDIPTKCMESKVTSVHKKVDANLIDDFFDVEEALLGSMVQKANVKETDTPMPTKAPTKSVDEGKPTNISQPKIFDVNITSEVLPKSKTHEVIEVPEPVKIPTESVSNYVVEILSSPEICHSNANPMDLLEVKKLEKDKTNVTKTETKSIVNKFIESKLSSSTIISDDKEKLTPKITQEAHEKLNKLVDEIESAIGIITETTVGSPIPAPKPLDTDLDLEVFISPNELKKIEQTKMENLNIITANKRNINEQKKLEETKTTSSPKKHQTPVDKSDEPDVISQDFTKQTVNAKENPPITKKDLKCSALICSETTDSSTGAEIRHKKDQRQSKVPTPENKNYLFIDEPFDKAANLPQAFKDSLKIEEIKVPGNTDPYMTMVKIILPNKKVFKATIQGRMSVGIDTIFDDPGIKKILLGQVSKKNRYTLNVRRGADGTVETIQKENKVVDIVDLVSDDEEPSMKFTINSSSYKVPSMDRSVFMKHQEKFAQKCRVPLQRCDYESKITSLVKSLSKDLSFKAPEIIELDNSSNSIDLTNTDDVKIDELKNQLLKDLGVDSILQNATIIDVVDLVQDSEPEDEPAVVTEYMESSASNNIAKLQDSKPDKITELQDFKPNNLIEFVHESSINGEEKQEIGKRFTRTRKSKYHRERDYKQDKQRQPMSVPVRSEQKKANSNIYNHLNIRQCKIKLIRCDDLLNKMLNNYTFQHIASGEDNQNKIEFSQKGSFSLLNNLDVPAQAQTTNKNRNSPVMEIFDIISTLQNASKSGKLPLKPQEYDYGHCETDWHATKGILHLLSKKQIIQKASENMSGKPDVTSNPETNISHVNVSNEKKALESLKVCSLKSIMAKYFEDNSLILELNPLVDTINKHFETAPVTLKRKRMHIQERNSKKITKFNFSNDVSLLTEVTKVGKEIVDLERNNCESDWHITKSMLYLLSKKQIIQKASEEVSVKPYTISDVETNTSDLNVSDEKKAFNNTKIVGMSMDKVIPKPEELCDTSEMILPTFTSVSSPSILETTDTEILKLDIDGSGVSSDLAEPGLELHSSNEREYSEKNYLCNEFVSEINDKKPTPDDVLDVSDRELTPELETTSSVDTMDIDFEVETAGGYVINKLKTKPADTNFFLLDSVAGKAILEQKYTKIEAKLENETLNTENFLTASTLSTFEPIKEKTMTESVFCVQNIENIKQLCSEEITFEDTMNVNIIDTDAHHEGTENIEVNEEENSTEKEMDNTDSARDKIETTYENKNISTESKSIITDHDDTNPANIKTYLIDQEPHYENRIDKKMENADVMCGKMVWKTDVEYIIEPKELAQCVMQDKNIDSDDYVLDKIQSEGTKNIKIEHEGTNLDYIRFDEFNHEKNGKDTVKECKTPDFVVYKINPTEEYENINIENDSSGTDLVVSKPKNIESDVIDQKQLYQDKEMDNPNFVCNKIDFPDETKNRSIESTITNPKFCKPENIEHGLIKLQQDSITKKELNNTKQSVCNTIEWTDEAKDTSTESYSILASYLDTDSTNADMVDQQHSQSLMTAKEIDNTDLEYDKTESSEETKHSKTRSKNPTSDPEVIRLEKIQPEINLESRSLEPVTDKEIENTGVVCDGIESTEEIKNASIECESTINDRKDTENIELNIIDQSYNDCLRNTSLIENSKEDMSISRPEQEDKTNQTEIALAELEGSVFSDIKIDMNQYNDLESSRTSDIHMYNRFKCESIMTRNNETKSDDDDITNATIKEENIQDNEKETAEQDIVIDENITNTDVSNEHKTTIKSERCCVESGHIMIAKPENSEPNIDHESTDKFSNSIPNIENVPVSPVHLEVDGKERPTVNVTDAKLSQNLKIDKQVVDTKPEIPDKTEVTFIESETLISEIKHIDCTADSLPEISNITVTSDNLSNDLIDWVDHESVIGSETEKSDSSTSLSSDFWENQPATSGFTQNTDNNKLIQTDMQDNNNQVNIKDISDSSYICETEIEVETITDDVTEEYIDSNNYQEYCDFYKKAESPNETNETNSCDEIKGLIVEKSIAELEDDDIILEKGATLLYKNDSGVILKGIEYKNLEIGTCYVFPYVKSPNIDEMRKTVLTNEDNEHSVDCYDDVELKVIEPKITYSKFHRKRRSDMRDIIFCEKRTRRSSRDTKPPVRKYRKGKNIDNPKITGSVRSESSYAKEYEHLLNYYSSIDFSYVVPYNWEYIDVPEIIKNWPQLKSHVPKESLDDPNECSDLFVDVADGNKKIHDPLQQTLAEELISDDHTRDLYSCDIEETNFNTGFGEGSGRVKQNLVCVATSNISAATLSDVKQSQPLLLSEVGDKPKNENANVNLSHNDQINRFYDCVRLRDKVKRFFENSSAELFSELNHAKDIYKKDKSNFPLDMYIKMSTDPRPVSVVVQVVQVGQLPVSAAAQNPVTCDPRVTQVSNASPSQCSAENSPHDDSSQPIKTEYTELTTAELNLPLEGYMQNNQYLETEETIVYSENIPIQTELANEIKVEMEDNPEDMENSGENNESDVNNANNIEYYCTNVDSDIQALLDDGDNDNKDDVAEAIAQQQKEVEQTEEEQQKGQNGSAGKIDQIARAMNAAGISTTNPEPIDAPEQTFVNVLSQKIGETGVTTTHNSSNFQKTTSINAMTLQQALAQILPSLNQTTEASQQGQVISAPQVLHIVQGKNCTGNQITLVDNSQQSVINAPNATPVLHIVQNKAVNSTATANSSPTPQTNTFSGISLVDAGLQQGGNQLLHIVNTGNQKNNNAGQLLKRVNLLTNLTHVQGSNEQKMVQFVCKSADGKSIQLNAPHQRSMVLRLQPIETPNVQPTPKPESDLSPAQNANNSTTNKDSNNTQQEIKSRSVYEENYAKFIQNSSNKPIALEKATSLPKFNQAFGKPVFQEGTEKQNDINTNNSNLPNVNSKPDPPEGTSTENTLNLDHISRIGSPPMLIRKPQLPTTQSPPNLVQQIKQTIAPMNIQTMHGGVIYTRQIPVNIGGGQTINLITVPSTDLIDETGQKQGEHIEPSIIKIVPQTQPTNSERSEEANVNNDNPQPQPVLTQMRIKLPMLSKAPQMVSGARVVRPSFFQIQRNVIGGPNQPVYQQLVLTAAPQLGQQTIRLPQAQVRHIKLPENQSSSESQMSTSTLEQLREFDMVLEQVKERSTVQPNSNCTTTFKLNTSSTDATDSAAATETTQVLYSIGGSQPLNVTYVNRKAPVATPTTSSFVRSPDSSGVSDSPSSSTQVQLPHTVTTEASSNESTTSQKPAKVGSKSKSKTKSTSHNPNSLKLNSVQPKTSTQKPVEDEQTTQRILYILAEYKEQVENSPDKDKPAPRRRINPPTNPSKRRKGCSGSRRSMCRDLSPLGDDCCRTMGSEDSSCGTSQGDCNESCLDSPQDSPRKVARKLNFDQDPVLTTPLKVPEPEPQPQPQNVIVADGQAITVARGTTAKPTTAVLMPTNYILPVSMVKGGQQIAIVTNRGPKLLTVGGGEGGATSALLVQRLIGPAGLKPVLTRPGVRHVRLPTAALHNLQAFNLATTTTVQPPDSTASTAGTSSGEPTPDVVDARNNASPWADRETEAKADRTSSPDEPEPWHIPTSADPHDYGYEETVRTDNMERTVLDPIPDRYSPGMEAQRIFDKMFDVDTKKSYIVDSHGHSSYDIDCDDKPYQVVHKNPRQTRLSTVAAATLRHKYAILEHELRLQKSLSEECEDLGVGSPSASELFPEAELLFAGSPAQDHGHDTSQHSHTSQPIILHQSAIHPDMDDQIATDQLIHREVHLRQEIDTHHQELDHHRPPMDHHRQEIDHRRREIAHHRSEMNHHRPEMDHHRQEMDHHQPEMEHHQPEMEHHQPEIEHHEPDIEHHRPEIEHRQDIDLGSGLEDVGIVTVSEDGMQATIELDQEEFARSHPNTTFHSEEEVQPYTLSNIKGQQITSTIYHSNRAPATVLMTAPQTTVISQAGETSSNVKYSNMDMIHQIPSTHNNIDLSSVLVKDDGLTRYDNILTDSRELHLSNTASAIVHASGNATQVIRRVCYDRRERESYLIDEPDAIIAGDDAKMVAEDNSSRDATMECMVGDDGNSSPDRHVELFWESNSASERSEGRRPLDFSSDSEKCCKSPLYDEANSTDSSGISHMRLDSVIKDARGIDRSGSADCSSAEDTHPPLRTYPPKRSYHVEGGEQRSTSGKTRFGEGERGERGRRASGRGVVKRGCQCCNGDSQPTKPKKPRQRKPNTDLNKH